MRLKTKHDIELELLAECRDKGFRPGSLFISKGDFWLPTVSGRTAIEPQDLTEYKSTTTNIFLGDIWMFVAIHAVINQGSWDFWFEFLNEDKTFYVRAFYALGRMKEQFEVKTND